MRDTTDEQRNERQAPELSVRDLCPTGSEVERGAFNPAVGAAVFNGPDARVFSVSQANHSCSRELAVVCDYCGQENQLRIVYNGVIGKGSLTCSVCGGPLGNLADLLEVEKPATGDSSGPESGGQG